MESGRTSAVTLAEAGAPQTGQNELTILQLKFSLVLLNLRLKRPKLALEIRHLNCPSSLRSD